MNLEFFHDPSAMGLDRCFGGTQFGGDFLVQFANDHKRENFAFAWREEVKLVLDFSPARILPEGGGILLTKSASIHSWFMFFRFDAIFLDREGRVTKVVHSMRPWWLAFGGRGAKDTLELPAGVAASTGTEKGDVLVFEPIAGQQVRAA